jgi:hypothetical protein
VGEKKGCLTPKKRKRKQFSKFMARKRPYKTCVHCRKGLIVLPASTTIVAFSDLGEFTEQRYQEELANN